MVSDVESAMYSSALAADTGSARAERPFELSMIRREDTVRVILMFVVLYVTLTAPESITDRIWLRTALLTAVLLTFWAQFAADWLGLRRGGQLDVGAAVVLLGDLVWIALLVHSTGGLESPFSSLLLVPILFAAGMFSQLRLALALVTGSVVGAFVVFALRAAGSVDRPWELTGMLMAIIAVAWVAYGICLVLDRERRTNELVLRHLCEAVLLLDGARRVILGNPEMEKLTGVPLRQMVGRTVDRIARNPQHAAFADLVADVISGRAADTPCTRDLTFEGPETVDLRISTIPCPGPVARPLGWVIVCQDTTDVRSDVRIREEGLNILSHEIRSPLTTLKVVASMFSALAEGLNDGSGARLVQVLQSETDRLFKIAGQLLDVAAIEHQGYSLDRAQTDIRGLVAKVTGIAQLRAAQRGITMHTRLPDSLPELSADAMRLEDALHQLCDNADKYTEPGGEIWVSAACDNGYVRISVADTGQGIPPESLDTIFDKFGQGAAAGDGGGRRGVGLGLYLVKRVAELHGGRIEVDSEIGRGSTFSILLPSGVSAA
jgi:signal transduction histidine kinase